MDMADSEGVVVEEGGWIGGGGEELKKMLLLLNARFLAYWLEFWAVVVFARGLSEIFFEYFLLICLRE